MTALKIRNSPFIRSTNPHFAANGVYNSARYSKTYFKHSYVLGRVRSIVDKYNSYRKQKPYCAVLKGIQRYQRGRQKSLSRKTDKTMANKMKRKIYIEHTALH